LPTGAAFNSDTHIFSYRPDYNSSGAYSNAHFEVTDGYLKSEEDITIIVNDAGIPGAAPQKPVVNAVKNPTNIARQVISGQKQQGTSIWINNQQILSRDELNTWQASYQLQEGDNGLIITSNDIAGNESAAVNLNIKLDTVAPDIQIIFPQDDQEVVLP